MTFRRVGRLARGYAPGQVDPYLARVEAALAGRPVTVRTSAATIRRAAFDLVLHGYDPAEVDAALDALELRALATEAALGQQPLPELAAEAGRLLARLAGAPGARFRRAKAWERGYRPEAVDALLDSVAGRLRGGTGPDADAVRESLFRPRRGGYDEDEVDAYLDQVVDLLLRRGVLAPGAS